MKNLLFTLVLLFSLHSFGQDFAYPSNPVTAAYIIDCNDITGFNNAITVPEGKFWTFSRSNAYIKWAFPDETTPTSPSDYSRTIYEGQSFLLENFKLYQISSSAGNDNTLYIYEHNFSTESGLSSTNVELPNQIRLFPNPTTSKVALNSDKQYDIEVYDILGNKVMELTGNTIDMEHLSSATYIVNALDTETNERLSYKVIKH
ncbi:MAG TPA: T9SS type A sorting domain-containing protein [Flavobacteriaceae bacterium]|nr:T9SS type A sorting domain-containing protein [Flavobacteriaceae bacterium]